MPSHAVIEPLRAALVERSGARSIRSIANACGVDYKRLLAFSQGGPPAFDVERLAGHLGLKLTYDAPDDEPRRISTGRTAR